jgi:hypothetical protein
MASGKEDHDVVGPTGRGMFCCFVALLLCCLFTCTWCFTLYLVTGKDRKA